MITASIAITGVALLAGGAMALASVPVRADADAAPTDRHEIPAFVLKRVDVAFENEPAPAAAPSPAHAVPAAGIATTGALQ